MVYLWALASGVSFAVAAVLQHREARAQPAELALSIGLLHKLLGRPLWWLGGLADAAGLLFQAMALGAGSIIAVEALRTSGLLVALGLGSAMGAGAMGPRQWTLAALMVVGITGFLVVGSPAEGTHRPSAASWSVVAAISAAIVGVVVAGTRGSRSALRALGLGVATGTVWALTACLLKRVVEVFSDSGPAAVLTSPALWALALGSVGGLVLNQSSFQAGELPWSLPSISVTEPVLGSAFGILLFHDRLRADSVPEGVVLIGFAILALTCVAVLAREPAEVAVVTASATPKTLSPGQTDPQTS